MIKEVKTLLGMEIKLEQMKLENGTVLEADSFDSGNEIFIVTEDERVALPVGEYILEDTQILVIEEEGIIKEVKAKEDEADEETVEEEVEVEAKDEMEFATKEDLQNVIAMIEEIKKMLEPKEEMKEEIKEELSAIPKEVDDEMKKPAVEPINTNAALKKTEVNFRIASKGKMSTMDRVLNKLNK